MYKGGGIIRLRNKFPQINSERHSELIASNWIQLHEPQNLASAVLLSIPLMILSALFSLKILDIFSPFSLADFGITPAQISVTIDLQDLVYFLGLSIVIIFIHELLHLVFVPDFLTSDKAFLGITYFGGFAYSGEVLPKSRFIFILLSPFVVTSIILPGALGALNLLNPLVKFVILSSAMGSGVDMLVLILILIQVPRGAYLTCNGMKTYWKRIDSSIPESN
jgi:hypothetical protein